VKSVTSNGKQNTRDLILHTLKTSSQAKVEELAEAADISPVTVRHHLNTLQADGLIKVHSIRRKVGRPYYVYSLSEKGHELFPQKYVRLTNLLLGELKARLPAEVVTELFSAVVQAIVEEHKGEFEKLSFEERLSYLVGLLAEEGFLAQWKKVGDGYQLTEYNCPYLSVGYKHAEICTFDKELILSVLQTPIQQHSCMLNGADCCHFTFSTATQE
jgi:predicted ArsR family transcriptional regulator